MSDKLTIATPLSVRVTETESKEAKLQADYRGMNVSDYVRHLLLQDKKVLKREFDALIPLFAAQQGDATKQASVNVGRE